METTNKEEQTIKVTKVVKIKDKVEDWILSSSRFQKLMEKTKYYLAHPDRINQDLTEAYNRASGETDEKNIIVMWEKLKLLTRMVKASIKNEYKNLPKVKLVLGIAVILYFLLPHDTVPDYLPAIGFTDDMALVLWFIRNASVEIKNFQEWETGHIPAQA